MIRCYDSIRLRFIILIIKELSESIIDDDDEFIVVSWIKSQLNVYALVWSNYIKIKYT